MPRARVSIEPGFFLGGGPEESREAGQGDPGKGPPITGMWSRWTTAWYGLKCLTWRPMGVSGGPSDSGRWEQRWIETGSPRLCLCVKCGGKSVNMGFSLGVESYQWSMGCLSMWKPPPTRGPGFKAGFKAGQTAPCAPSPRGWAVYANMQNGGFVGLFFYFLEEIKLKSFS